MTQNRYVFRRCGCTTVVSGSGRTAKRQLRGTDCPLRNDERHGSWWFQTDLPRRAGVRRRQLRRGGFNSADTARAAIDHVAALLTVPDPLDDKAHLEIADLIQEVSRKGRPLPALATVRAQYRNNEAFQPSPFLADWLPAWLNGRKKLRDSTRVNYECLIRLYLVPYLGELRLNQIRVDHLTDMFERIEDFNTFIALVRATGTPEMRREIKWRRAAQASTHRRILSVLNGALKEAVRQQLITFNPAACVELGHATQPHPLVWTRKRVAQWRATGTIPSSVMVWTPEQTGAFLDHIARDDQYLLFHILIYLGLRRGEACGLTWNDIDLDEHELHVNQQLTLINGVLNTAPPKTLAGLRELPLDQPTVNLLARHQRRTLTTQTSTGLVFTDASGQPLQPDKVTERFKRLVAEADLPPIRLHDLRHGTATMLLAAGVDLKVIQELLGHSRYNTTADFYTSVLPTLTRTSTATLTDLIPRA